MIWQYGNEWMKCKDVMNLDKNQSPVIFEWKIEKNERIKNQNSVKFCNKTCAYMLHIVTVVVAIVVVTSLCTSSEMNEMWMWKEYP